MHLEKEYGDMRKAVVWLGGRQPGPQGLVKNSNKLIASLWWRENYKI